MNRSILPLLFLLASLSGGDLPAQKLKILWQITENLDSPESAYVDPRSGFLFLSQIGGSGREKDGRGWISKLTTDGHWVEEKWITGLNAPKGLRSHGDTLWVSDIDRIVGMKISSGKIIHDVPVPGAKFLNDLACGPDGTVYVADMIASRIYAYREGKLSIFAEGERMESPNGLLVHDGKLYVAAWGFTDDFNPTTPGRLFSLDLKTKKKTLITRQPTGNLDGLEIDRCGDFFVTDWKAGKLFYIRKNGEAKVIYQGKNGEADHAYLRESDTIIIPQMLEKKLTAYRVIK